MQTPGGERVPYLFTVKGLVAKGSEGSIKPGLKLAGDYIVPSYRTGALRSRPAPRARHGSGGGLRAARLP